MGGTRFIYEVTSIINNSKNYQAEIVCNLGEKNVIKQFEKNKIKINTISKFCTNNIIYWTFLPIFIIYDTYKSIRYLKGADIILATVYPSNLICAIASIILKKKYYYYCFEPLPFFHNQEYINDQPKTKKNLYKLLSFLYGWTDVWATRKATKILTLDSPKKDLIKETYGVSSTVTSIGVYTNHFKPYPNNKIQKKYSDKIIISHSTDYTPLKRTDLAIKTIQLLYQEFPNVILFVTSTRPNTPEKQSYQQLINKLNLQNHVKLLGYVPYSDLPLYRASSLCYVSTSYNKMTCTNMPVKEAAACGTPIIRADVPQEDDIKNNISGFIVNTKNPKEIAKKIKYLINNPQKSKKMGQEARKAILNRFTWNKVTSIILKEIENL